MGLKKIEKPFKDKTIIEYHTKKENGKIN